MAARDGIAPTLAAKIRRAKQDLDAGVHSRVRYPEPGR